MAKKGAPVLLLTGLPGVGKTTALRRAAKRLADLEIRGFFTKEIRKGGVRMGFQIETFDGDSAVLAHVGIRSPHRVSKYGVDVAALDRVLDDQFPSARGKVVLIDEVGKMECLSRRFVETVESLLESARVFVAAVALRGGGFIDAIKRRQGNVLWRVDRTNREEMPARVAEWVRRSLRS